VSALSQTDRVALLESISCAVAAAAAAATAAAEAIYVWQE